MTDAAIGVSATSGERLVAPGARLVLGCLRYRWRYLVPGIVVALGYTGFRVAVPLLIRSVVDRAGAVAEGGAGAGFPLVLTTLVLAAGLAQATFAGLRRFSAMRLAIRVQADLRQRLFEHYQRLSFSFHDRVQVGQLMARANSDAEQVQNLVVYIPLTLANLLTFLAAVFFAFWIAVPTGIAAVLVLPLITLAARALATRLTPAAFRLQGVLARLTEIVEEAFRGVRVIKALGGEPAWERRFRESASEVRSSALEVAYVRARYAPLVALLSGLAVLSVMLTGGIGAARGQVSIGDLIASMFFVQMMAWPLQLLGDLAAQAQRAMVAAGRIAEVLAADPVIEEAPDAVDVPRRGGDIKFEDVWFSYGDGRSVLEGVDLAIEPGETVALVGRTGSGKSTIAALVPRFYDVQRGRVSVDGVDVRKHRLASLRDRIAVVFEDNFLFTDTVYRNIAYGAPDATEEEVRRAAQLACADEFIERLPEGYQTVVGEQGLTLSGGQRQRIALARALLKDPEILILDSPTSAVDTNVERELVEALRSATRGRTSLIVTDRPGTVQLADRVYYLEEGRVVAVGKHETLLRSEPGYAMLMGVLHKGSSSTVAEAESDGVERGTQSGEERG